MLRLGLRQVTFGHAPLGVGSNLRVSLAELNELLLLGGGRGGSKLSAQPMGLTEGPAEGLLGGSGDVPACLPRSGSASSQDPRPC